MFIEGKFTRLNQYVTANRSKKNWGASIKKKETHMAYVQMLNQPKIETPCRFKFTWYFKKPKNGKFHDPDNIAFCKKYILDAMKQAKLIPEDSLEHIKGFIDEFVISDKEGVEVMAVEEKSVLGFPAGNYDYEANKGKKVKVRKLGSGKPNETN